MKLAVVLFVALLIAWQAVADAFAYVTTGPIHRAGVKSTWTRVTVADRAERALRLALSFRGVPYVWGGTTPGGFDCSGLVQYVYRAVGIFLPRTTWSQMRVGKRVSMTGLQPGDVVFVNGGEHEGMYVGHGTIVDAPHSGTVVRLDPLAWFRFTAARRFA